MLIKAIRWMIELMDKRKPKPAAGGTGAGGGNVGGFIHLANVECEVVKREGTVGYWVIVHPSGFDGLLMTDLEYAVGQRVSANVSTTLPIQKLLYLTPAH